MLRKVEKTWWHIGISVRSVGSVGLREIREDLEVEELDANVK
jgi:hypothetical protein